MSRIIIIGLNEIVIFHQWKVINQWEAFVLKEKDHRLSTINGNAYALEIFFTVEIGHTRIFIFNKHGENE